MSREIRYWQQTGLALGTERYRRYLRLFGLTELGFQGQTVCDFGCGPFGGVLSVLENLKIGYPVDILADEYNRWGYARQAILPVASVTAPIPKAACGAVFCLNALDHVRDWRGCLDELSRITKPGGTLFLLVHLRQPTKGHYRISQTWVVRHLTDTDWRILTMDAGPDVPNNEPKLHAIWLSAERLA